MASPTKKLKVRRALAKCRVARKRKNKIRLYGSTNTLALNQPNANEKKMNNTN